MSEITNYQQAADAIRNLPENMKVEGMQILRVNAELIVGYAQIFCPVNIGNLRDSIRIEETADSIIIKVGGVTAPYAAYVESKTHFLEYAVMLVLPQLKDQLQTKIQGLINNVENRK